MTRNSSTGDLFEEAEPTGEPSRYVRLADERFLILPHAEVAEYVRRKASDPDRWIAGMRKLQRRVRDGLG